MTIDTQSPSSFERIPGFEMLTLDALKNLNFEAQLEELQTLPEAERAIIATIQDIRSDLQQIDDPQSVADTFFLLSSPDDPKKQWLLSVLDLSEEQKEAIYKKNCLFLVSHLKETISDISHEEGSHKDIDVFFANVSEELTAQDFSSLESVTSWWNTTFLPRLQSFVPKDDFRRLEEGGFFMRVEGASSDVSLDVQKPLAAQDARIIFSSSSLEKSLRMSIVSALQKASPEEKKHVLSVQLKQIFLQEWERLYLLLKENITDDAVQTEIKNSPETGSFMSGISQLQNLQKFIPGQANNSFHRAYQQSILHSVLPLNELYALDEKGAGDSQDQAQFLFENTGRIQALFHTKAQEIADNTKDLETLEEDISPLEETVDDTQFLIQKIKTVSAMYMGTEYETQYVEYVRETGGIAQDFDEWIGAQDISPWKRLMIQMSYLIRYFKGLTNSDEVQKKSDELLEAENALEGLLQENSPSELPTPMVLIDTYKTLENNPNIDIFIPEFENDIRSWSLQENGKTTEDLDIISKILKVKLYDENSIWYHIVKKGLRARTIVDIYREKERGTVYLEEGLLKRKSQETTVVLGALQDNRWENQHIQNILSSSQTA